MRFRNLWVGILLCSIIATAFRNAGVYIWFEINRDYIAQNLCINRNVPASKCNGACQLKKRIAESERGDPGTPVRTAREAGPITLFFVSQEMPRIQAPDCTVCSPMPFTANILRSTGSLQGVFQPPEC